MSRDLRLPGALLVGAAAAFALVTCGSGGEGTVVGKADQGVYDYGCQAADTMVGPAALPGAGFGYVLDNQRWPRRRYAGPRRLYRVTAFVQPGTIAGGFTDPACNAAQNSRALASGHSS